MASLRVLLLLLVAVYATSAASIPANVLVPSDDYESADSYESIRAASAALDAEIIRISDAARTRGITSDAVEAGIEKLKELVKLIKNKIETVEKKAHDAIKSLSENIVRKINDEIKKLINVDLGLDEKWEAFEAKTEQCSDNLKAKLWNVLTDIKTEAKTCTATQINTAKLIVVQLKQLSELVEIIPVRTIKNIKACTSDGSENNGENESDDGEQGDDTNADDESYDTNSDADDTVKTNGQVDRISIPEIWKRTKCVVNELTTAATDLKELPTLVYLLTDEITKLTGKESRKQLAECARKVVSGKGTAIQVDAAELAYCIVAPVDQ